MKRSVFAFIIVLLGLVPCYGQPDKESEFVIEDMPFPEGGLDAFKTWIKENNRYKKISDTIEESETVYVQFTVDTTGSLTNMLVVRGYEPVYDKEAIRLVGSCPIKWTAAKQNGIKVPVDFTMPISFLEVTSRAMMKKIEDRNKSIILKVNEEIFNKGNLSFADEVFAGYYNNDGGPEYIKERVNTLKTAFPDLRVSVQSVIVDGSLVAWRRDHYGTHKGEYMGFPPTGEQISWESIIISQMYDSVIVLEWGSSNLLEVLQKNMFETK